MALLSFFAVRQYSHSSCAVQFHRLFSSTAATKTSNPKNNTKSSLKKLIQPFVWKCHPDTAQQHGLPRTAIKVNVRAIQNLHSYIDNVVSFVDTQKYPFGSYESVDIEFVIAFGAAKQQNTKHASQQPTTSRRRIELQVPSPQLPISRVTPHVQRQIVKLLRMADLPIPPIDSLDDDDNYDEEDGSNRLSAQGSDDNISDAWMVDQVLRTTPSKKTAWDRSRERFVARINWNKFDQVYEEALRDAQANISTQGMIRNNPKLRKQLLAKVLSRVVFSDDVSPLERLVAYRRLYRILEQYFDDLLLESYGHYWESLVSQIYVTGARPYNTSSSAMRKRRQKYMETGYRFTIHLDNRVTVQIPVDFRDEELVEELVRNLNDFYEWTLQGRTGLEDILS